MGKLQAEIHSVIIFRLQQTNGEVIYHREPLRPDTSSLGSSSILEEDMTLSIFDHMDRFSL